MYIRVIWKRLFVKINWKLKKDKSRENSPPRIKRWRTPVIKTITAQRGTTHAALHTAAARRCSVTPTLAAAAASPHPPSRAAWDQLHVTTIDSQWKPAWYYKPQEAGRSPIPT